MKEEAISYQWQRFKLLLILALTAGRSLYNGHKKHAVDPEVTLSNSSESLESVYQM